MSSFITEHRKSVIDDAPMVKLSYSADNTDHLKQVTLDRLIEETYLKFLEIFFIERTKIIDISPTVFNFIWYIFLMGSVSPNIQFSNFRVSESDIECWIGR